MSGGVSVIRGEAVVHQSYTKSEWLTNDVILSLAEGNDGVIGAMDKYLGNAEMKIHKI